MSQPQDPFDPGNVPPAAPVSPPVRVVAQPYGGPLNVLPYTVPATNARPGLVTGIGVASIIISVTSLLIGGFGTLMALGFFIASTTAPVLPAAADPMGPNGYDQSDRRTIVQAMNLSQRLTSPQREHLQFFIADVGRLYVPTVPITSPTNDAVADWKAANISASGAGVEGGAWFDLPMGKLTVTDQSASLVLADGKTITRTATRQVPGSPNLTPQEVAAVVNRIQEMSASLAGPSGTSGGLVPITPAVATKLTTTLQANSAQIFGNPTDMPALLGQVSAVNSTPSGVFITFSRAIVIIPPNGSPTVSPTGFTGGPGAGMPKLASTPAAIVLIEGALSLGLAVYLFVIGILTLRNSPAGGKLHKVYAWLKILLAVTAGGGLFWLIVGSGGTASWGWVSGVLTLVIGIIYPIVLLLVLPTKSLREWFSVQHVN